MSGEKKPKGKKDVRATMNRRGFLTAIGAATGSYVGCQVAPKAMESTELGSDQDEIAFTKVFPSIGVARVGNHPTEFYLGPESTDQALTPIEVMRKDGRLKRQGARFRVYGYNAQGKLVREITSGEAKIEWSVHLANQKASWYQFRAALDIPESHNTRKMHLPRRNPEVVGKDRRDLTIDGGRQSISGPNQRSAKISGRFNATESAKRGNPGANISVEVALGELQTDQHGRVMVLGGTGIAKTPYGKTVFDTSDLNSFNNASGWFDDTSDGPVHATVTLPGKDPMEATPAWVIVGPPNYAPDVIGWRTLYDLLEDNYIESGMITMPQTSFTDHVLPALSRLSNLQWVNKGFDVHFGPLSEFDFSDQDLLLRLASPNPTPDDQDLRKKIFGSFRFGEQNDRETWPQLYGDAFGSFDDMDPRSPRNELAVSSVRQKHLENWLAGNFASDFQPSPQKSAVGTQDPSDDPLAAVPVEKQPYQLTRASLDTCLADAFHPGCELTWPMRHVTMYSEPFRIKVRETPERDYGDIFTNQALLVPDGPFHSQTPGGLSRWMAIPWQGDTVFCRSGYDPDFDPYLPAYWPARVPNQVLTESDYRIAIDTRRSREERIEAFGRRRSWVRFMRGGAAQQIEQMVRDFGSMGVVVAMPGISPSERSDSFPLPTVMFVERVGDRLKTPSGPMHMPVPRSSESRGEPTPKEQRILDAGWESVEQFEEFRRLRGLRR